MTLFIWLKYEVRKPGFIHQKRSLPVVTDTKRQRKFKVQERIRLRQSRVGFLFLATTGKTFPPQSQALHRERNTAILIRCASYPDLTEALLHERGTGLGTAVPGASGALLCRLDTAICPSRLDELRSNLFTLSEAFSRDIRSSVPVCSPEY